MYVPDVTDVNGGRMKAEQFPCLTEDLISLFWVFGREGSRRIFKCCDVSGNDGDYSFDLYLSRFAERVCSSSHSHLGYQLLRNCWELSALHKGTLVISIKQRKSMCRM